MEAELRIETADGPMRLFTASPDAEGPHPAAVMFMDGVGYRDELKRIARRYAAAGYHTVVGDLFHHFGDDVVFDLVSLCAAGMVGPDAERLFETIRSLTPELVEADTAAVLEHLDEVAPGPAVAVGYCMGARHLLRGLAAFPDRFAAGCGLHPGVLVNEQPDSPHHDLAAARGEVYLGFAERDPASAPEVVAALEETAREHGVALDMETYPDTDHGFVMSDLPMYHRAASERHFARTLGVWERTRDPQ